MKVWINGEKVTKTYEEICHDLGFIPETHFVTVSTCGSIGFSAGKRDEIRQLYRAIHRKGYKPSMRIVRTIRNLSM